MQLHRLAVEALDGAAFELVEQVALIMRDYVDQVLLQSFLIGPRLRLAHRGLRQLHVAPSRPDVRAHEGGRVVLDLGLHGVVHLLAAESDGMRRSGVGPGSHGRHVGGFEDEEASRSRSRPAGSNIDDDRYRRGQDLLDDGASGIQQAARRAQFDQHGIGVGLARVFDGAINVLGRNRLNGVIHTDLDDAVRRSQAGCRVAPADHKRG